MNAELEAFRAELKAAGEPWQQRGIRIVLVGLAFLAAAQILSAYALVLLYLAIALIAVGWGFLIVAFVRRRRWARTHDLSLPEPPTPPAA